MSAQLSALSVSAWQRHVGSAADQRNATAAQTQRSSTTAARSIAITAGVQRGAGSAARRGDDFLAQSAGGEQLQRGAWASAHPQTGLHPLHLLWLQHPVSVHTGVLGQNCIFSQAAG